MFAAMLRSYAENVAPGVEAADTDALERIGERWRLTGVETEQPYAGPVLVEAWSDSDTQIFVRVADEGVGMVPRPDSPGLGMGLPLMAQMADDVHVATRRDEPGTMVVLRFSCPSAGA